MNREEKIDFARKHLGSIYPRVNILLIPEQDNETMKAVLSSISEVKDGNLIPCEEVYRVNGYISLSGIIDDFKRRCRMIKKEYIPSKSDITLRDLWSNNN